jgi:type I restriction enzyme M protein
MRLEEFNTERDWWKKRQESEQSWKVSAAEIAQNNYNLDIKNPNVPLVVHDDPDELLHQFKVAMQEVANLQNELKIALNRSIDK